MLPFAIVQFVDGGGLAVIPSRWFTGPEEEACFWPPGRTNISKAVLEGYAPQADWTKHKLCVLGKAGNVSVIYDIISV